MASGLNGRKIAFLFTEGVEQVELTKPLEAVREAGGTAALVSLEKGEVQMFNHLDKGDTIAAEVAVSDADPPNSTGSSCRAAWRIPTLCVATRTPSPSYAASSTSTSPWA
jgi:hypothetical protein